MEPIAAIRRSIAARPLRAFEYLEIAPRPDAARLRRQALGVIEQGVRIAGEKRRLAIQPPVDWSRGNRSANFHLHAFQPIRDVIAAYDATGERVFLDAARDFAFDWLDANMPAFTGAPDAALIDACLADPHISRWYDMGVGQRIHRLAYLADALARQAGAPDADIARLADAIRLHHALLADARLYKAHSNHGFFQALTQYAAAKRLPELDDHGYLALAFARLETMIERQYHADGAHAEHSPGYHHMVTVALINARNDGLIEGALAERIGRFEEVHSLFIKSDGRIATIGDTDPRMFRSVARFAGLFEDEAMRFIVSGGAEGAPPPAGVTALRDSGYAVARLDPAGASGTRFGGQSYLIQATGFHSRTHKQADHLTFVWQERRRDILTDPGRFAYLGRTTPGDGLAERGFIYADPRRIHVERTRAHNCVEIDGRSHPRLGVAPFGSGLRRAALIDGLAVFESEAPLEGTVTQRRALILRPGHFLLVLDALDDPERAHDYRQWFCMGRGWIAARDPDPRTLRAVAGEAKRSEMRVTALTLNPRLAWEAPVRGQTEPELLGWLSNRANKLVPATSLCIAAPKARTGRFATLFVLGAQCVVEQDGIDSGADGQLVVARWRDERGAHRLTLEEQDGACRPRFETQEG